MKLNIDKLLNIIIVFCITIWTIGGSLYYMLDIKSVLLMIVVYAFCFFVLICKNHITVNKIFILFIMQTMFLLFKNEDLRRGIYYISNPIIYLSILALIYILKDLNYQDILKKYFKFIKIGYFIYASFTIIYFFSKPLFMVINYSLFPFAIDRMTEQYMKGCMCGLTNHYSTNGMLLAVGTILFGCESLFVQKINKKKLVLFIYMVIALLLTGKRAHVMFTIISLLIVAYFYMSNNKNKRFINFLKIFISLLVVGIIIISFFPQLATVITRFQETAETGDITLGRTEMWKRSFIQFIKSPILGIGWGRARNYNWIDTHIHNIYVQLLVETGVIGVIVFIFGFVYFLVETIKLLKRFRCGSYNKLSNETNLLCISLGIQIYFLLYGFTGNCLYEKENYIPYLVSCGIYFCIKKVVRS